MNHCFTGSTLCFAIDGETGGKNRDAPTTIEPRPVPVMWVRLLGVNRGIGNVLHEAIFEISIPLHSTQKTSPESV